MRFAKIARAGYPANVVCTVVKYGKHESTIKLPTGEEVTLYTAFLREDTDTRKKDREFVLSRSQAITSKPRRRH